MRGVEAPGRSAAPTSKSDGCTGQLNWRSMCNSVASCNDLMRAIGNCEVPYKTSDTDVRWIPATNINARSFKMGESVMTVGQFLTVEGASRYPTEVRYGDRVVHFPPDAALKAARTIIQWGRDNWEDIRWRAK